MTLPPAQGTSGAVIAMAVDRDQAGRLVVRHNGRDTIALNYPAGAGYNVTTLIPPDTTVALDGWETSRDEAEDARFDAAWGRLGGTGTPDSLQPGRGHR